MRCTRGAIYDVIIDLRPDSPTCGQWHGEELTGSNSTHALRPRRVRSWLPNPSRRHGNVLHDVRPFAPEAARGVRYDAVAFGILWPLTVTAISDQDRKWPDNWR